MPTKIKIVLPVSLEDDAVSVTDNENHIDRGTDLQGQTVEEVNENTSGKRDVAENFVRTIGQNEQSKTLEHPNRAGKCLSKHQNHQNKTTNDRQFQGQPQQRGESARRKWRCLSNLNQNPSGNRCSQACSNSDHVHSVGLNKSQERTHSFSDIPLRQEAQKCSAKSKHRLGYFCLSIADSYDLDAEYHGIILKALKSCLQQRREVTGTNDRYKSTKLELLKRCLSNQLAMPFSADSESYETDQSQEIKNHLSNENAPVSAGSLVQLSQCRLQFFDDEDTTKRITDSKNAVSLPLSPTPYDLEDGNGVLVDSVGHVCNSRRVRPWSALPGRFSDLVRTSRQESGLDGARKYSRTKDSANTSRNNLKRNTNPTNSLVTSSASCHLKIVTLQLGDTMSQPIPHSVAYQRRNQTTHMWTDSSELMSRSLPASTFMYRSPGSSASSPRSSRDATSEKTSPAGKPTKARPSSSYSYDGGFFVGAHTGQAEYFVIHPDWVSEAVSVKKLSLGKKSNVPLLQRSSSLTLRSLQGRRCLSAPPKSRNPITWAQSESADIPRK